MELSPEQILIVGFVASILGVILRLIFAKVGGVELGKGWMSVIVSVVALILAVLFNIPQLPVYTEPLPYVAAWLALISGYLGAATLIYNLLLDKVLDKFDGLQVEKLASG